MSSLTEALVLEALKTVQDPELHKDLVSLGMVEQVSVQGDRVAVRINLTTPACPLKERIAEDVRSALEPLGAAEVEVHFGAQVRGPQNPPLPGIKHIVAVASGKGGVGKSTVAANLAVALAQEGARVGLLDADIYGPSQAQMFGVQGEKLRVDEQKRMVPLERHGVKLISMANIVPAGQAMVWRGPILHGAVRQFLQEVAWGELDYLVVDLPPGTGDVQLSLSQLTQLSGGVIVTTPQEVACIDAERALDMFRRTQVEVLGIVENMSFFEQNGQRTYIFGQGGGRRMAERHRTAFLGEIPLALSVREAGDGGIPVVAGHPSSAEAEAFRQVARNLAGRLSVKTQLLLPMA
ncbi:MAG: Mrp/NBP35 family ATP-binding protein [Meiothermus sp.]|uniref:Mrp/NBP35 family ATP-binding protein n=1 Tax=Meiothermus sp. TaxID=1955249 RepID=UPI0025FCF425|nr:Mrp/NBP35 family ATP-binding protein [Meiothermus sp.]MCS7057540.1 Mrp/NBP35 family ATP-binding protein [Meiothermus sp.]MCX7740017.1 Mrp/NBP35 family ATP-binding protein [Meiothermus sp.]MDW8481659.1 Mrp/NBP35 family ATP-binding protein [Meiothermus sp.]